jgi:hypothetical protein
MRLIAHRALINGPDQNIENHPDQIVSAIGQGFDCEVDLWFEDSRFYLGHDEPQYAIDKDFLIRHRKNLWIHAKNLPALYWLTNTNKFFNHFWHQTDDFVITSQGYIWAYPGKMLTDRSVMVMPEWADPEFKTILKNPCYAICSDYVMTIKDIIANDRNLQRQDVVRIMGSDIHS